MALPIVLTGCLTPHRVLVLADYEDGATQREHALESAKIAADPREAEALRAYAFEVLGKLRVYDPAVEEALVRGLTSRGAPGRVRTWAAWALGEIARDQPWMGPAARLHGVLLEAMDLPASAETAYALCEALGKFYPLHAHDAEESIETTRALSRLAAHQRQQMPDLYYVVLERVTTLDVLIDAMARTLAESDHSKDAKLEVYDAALTVLRFFDAHREPLAVSFHDRRTAITAALGHVLDGMEENWRALHLLILWYLGRVARDPQLAQIVAEELARATGSPDPTVRLVAVWSGIKLSKALFVGDALRHDRLTKETSPDVLRVFRELSKPGQQDALQRLFGVNPVEERVP